MVRIVVRSLFALLPLALLADQEVYTDSLQNGWESWSWASSVNFKNTSPVHSGSQSVAVTLGVGWQAIYLHHVAFDSSGYTNLSFWIHGGSSGGQKLQVQAEVNGVAQTAVTLTPLSAGAWRQVTISLAELGVESEPALDGFWIQDITGGAQPTFYLDDVRLVAGSGSGNGGSGLTAAIQVDGDLNRHPISPLIYGVAFASSNQLAQLNAPLNRSGGNSETRYNWQLNAHNHAADWYFESIADSPATPAAAADSFVSDSKGAGAEPMITIPMIGWVPKLGPNRGKLASYSVAKYGPQTGRDSQWMPDAGNGISSTNGSKPITWNDPNDANSPADSAFQAEFMRHLTNRWGTSQAGGVRYYFLDNEHSLWHSTHQDIHPNGATMSEIRDKCFEYADMIKTLDPAALVLGPEEWGWSGYFWSGADQQWSGAHNDWNPAHFPDRSANGGMDFIPWLLDQFRGREEAMGKRLLDVCTLHVYPQNGEFGSDVSTAMQLTRNRSTRQLWDTNYVDPSWIGSVVKLIPRLKSWVAAYYPGTKIGITEYNWGAESHMNGATAQADILGIFGREGLDIGTRWTTPGSDTPTFKAMQIYRNYDGKRGGFGDVSVSASGPDPDKVSTFAAVRTNDGALTLMVINKQAAVSATASVSVSNLALAGTGEVWQLSSSNLIQRMPDVAVVGNGFTNTVPAQSITLFVVPTVNVKPPTLVSGGVDATGRYRFEIQGMAGQKYAIESTADFRSWTGIETNTLTGSAPVEIPVSLAQHPTFYRALWLR